MKKVLIINLIVFFSIILALEISARIYLSIKLGNQKAGLKMRNINLEYEPFVMYGPNWDKIFQKYNEELDDGDFNVLLIGGSTALNFPKEILEKSLTEKLNKNVKVFNGAYGGYISSQELVVLTRYGNKIRPDLVINLNGANDILHSLRKNVKSGTFYLNSTYELFLTKPYLAPFFKILQNSQLYNGLIRITERNVEFIPSDYFDHLEIYIKNVESMLVFCKGLGVEYINILQPHVVFKQKKNENEIKFTFLNYRDEIVKQLYEIVKNKANTNNYIKNNFFDSSLIFENNEEHIFVDDVHFTKGRGYNILADFISSKVKLQ